MKVLLINGSHRAGSSDRAIGKLVVEISSRGVENRELRLREIEIKLPDGCKGCAESEICPNTKDEFSEVIEPTLHNYDVYILVTPTWSDQMTPLTKIFWDRIVSWCHPDRMYLKDKKLALVVHGMAGEDSWNNVISWVKSVCVWEECKYAGSLTFKSGSGVGELELNGEKISEFVQNILL